MKDIFTCCPSEFLVAPPLSPFLSLWGFRSRKMSVNVWRTRRCFFFSFIVQSIVDGIIRRTTVFVLGIFTQKHVPDKKQKFFSLAFLLPRRWWNKDVIRPGIPFVNSYNNFSADAHVSLYFRKPVNYYFLSEFFFSLMEFLLIYLSAWKDLILLSIKLCILLQSNSVLSITDERELSGCWLCTNCCKAMYERKKSEKKESPNLSHPISHLSVKSG